MPRKYARREAVRRRRTYGKKRKNTIKKMVNRALRSNLEVKRVLTGATEVSVSTLSPGASTNWVLPLTGIAQGTNSFNRIGNKIKVTGIQIKNFFHNNTTVPIWLRFVIMKVVDRAALTTTSAIFSGTSNQEADFGNVNGMAAMMRPLDRSVVHPVYEKVFKLTANSAEGVGAFKRLNRFIKFPRGLNVDYNSTGTTVTSVVPTYVFGVWAAEAPEDIGAGSVAEWSYQHTVFFTDA